MPAVPITCEPAPDAGSQTTCDRRPTTDSESETETETETDSDSESRRNAVRSRTGVVAR